MSLSINGNGDILTLSSATTAAAVYTPSGAGAVATTVQAKLRESVSVKDFGAVGNGVTVDYAAFVAAVAASLSGTFPYQSSGKIVVPAGTYNFGSNTLTLTSQVTLVGEGEGQQTTGTAQSTLKWNADTVGIVCQKAWGPSTAGCDGSILQGLYLQGGGGVGSTAHGVDMKARIVMRDCYVTGFRGNGINIVASSASNQNANGWRLDNVTCTNNNGHGVYAQGSDANAGVATLVDCTSNGGWGIWDSSFLGNTWVGCHTSGNTLGGYKTDNANASAIFTGCYSETGQPASQIALPSMFINGSHQPAITGEGTLMGNSVQGIKAGMTTATSYDGVGQVVSGLTELNAGGVATPNSFMKFQRLSVSGSAPYRFKHATGKYWCEWANIIGFTPFILYDRNHVTLANGFARDITAFSNMPLGLPNGVLEGAGMLMRTSASAVPASGNWIVGDYVKNSNPVVGQPKGWYCTVSGTPGTWVSEGNL